MLQYFHNGADTVQDQMTLVASGGMKTSMPATLIIRILPVNDEMPILVNNTGLEVWAGATSPITHRHLGKINHQIPFKNFSATSASNGSLLEWKITLFHNKTFLVGQFPL